MRFLNRLLFFAFGALAVWGAVETFAAGQNEAALAWGLGAAIAAGAILSEMALDQRRREIADMAQAILAQRKAIAAMARDLIEASDVVTRVARAAQDIEGALS